MGEYYTTYAYVLPQYIPPILPQRSTWKTRVERVSSSTRMPCVLLPPPPVLLEQYTSRMGQDGKRSTWYATQENAYPRKGAAESKDTKPRGTLKVGYQHQPKASLRVPPGWLVMGSELSYSQL